MLIYFLPASDNFSQLLISLQTVWTYADQARQNHVFLCFVYVQEMGG